MTCGARCDHLFNETTCEYCGYYSAGIDNPLTVCYMDTEAYVPYSASFYYTVSIIDTSEYMPITICSDEPLSGEQIIARAGVDSPERFFIYVDISEYYELDNFKSMVFTYSCQIDFHLAG